MYGTDWTERIDPDEEERFTDIARRLAALQANRNEKYGESARALHRQAVGSGFGRFVVRKDLADVLPPELHVGPFAPGASFGAYVRFSQGGWERRRKDTADVRGVAIKLLGVSGPKCLGTANTQDFLLNHTRARAPRSPEEFIALIEAAATGSPAGIGWRLGRAIGFVRAFQLIKGTLAGLQTPFAGFASGTYWSMSPYRFGASAAMYSMAAVDPAPARPGGFAADLASRLREGVAFTFRVQLYESATTTPIEDPTVQWETPFVDVARLELPPTDADDPGAVELADTVERLGFDPWHAVEELRPLGAFNRARKATYFAGSVQHRPTIDEDRVQEPTARGVE